MKVDALTEINRSLELGYVPDNSESPVVDNVFNELHEYIEDVRTRHQEYEPILTKPGPVKRTDTLLEHLTRVSEIREIHTKVLRPKERAVMSLINNFDLEEKQKWNRSIEEVASILRISPGRVRQIKEKAIRKLRKLGGLL